MTTKRDQAKNLVSSSEKLLSQANEAFKAPAAEVAQAQSKAQISEKSVSRWKAESINFTRHQEIRALYGLEDELASLDELLEESKNIFPAAQQAVDTAAAALNSLPQKISDQQQVVSKKRLRLILRIHPLSKSLKTRIKKFPSFNRLTKSKRLTNNRQARTRKTKIWEKQALSYLNLWHCFKKIYKLLMLNCRQNNKNLSRHRLQFPQQRLSLPRL